MAPKRKSYLTKKANAGPTVQIKGGKFETADLFVAFGGIFVLIMVVVLGGGWNKNTDEDQVNTNNQVLSNQRPVVSGTTTSQTPTTQIPTVRTTSTDSASNAATDEPDASIEASLQAGNDQSGPPSSSTPNLQEIQGQKFKIGGGGSESMHGRGLLHVERNVAKKLEDELKYANQLAKKESSIADALSDEAKKVKTISQNNKENYSIVPGVFSMGTGGIPFHQKVGGGPTDDPFDIFSSALAQKETQPNIDYSGFGHTTYTAGNLHQRSLKAYPTRNEIYVYEKRPLKRGWADKMYSDNQRNPPVSYSHIEGQNEIIQQQRNTQGFTTPTFLPLDMKIRYPNNDFLPKDTPHNMNRYQQSEKAIGNELGDTGHSWTDRTLKSGIKGTAAQPGKMGTTDDSTLDPRNLEESAQDWEKIKVKVRGSVNRIVKLFDRMFHEELFPDAVVDVQEDGTIYVRDGKEGKCILLARYYEYVESTIKATLGLGKTGPLTWAKSVDLNFEAVEKNKMPLRKALTQTCAPKLGYIIDNDSNLKTADGAPIVITIPWPKDRTTLLSHKLKLGTV